VAPSGTSATIAQVGPALPSSATAIDPYQSDPFWSHDGSYLVYTSFNTPATADSTGNPGGLNGDLKKGGQIAIADATPETIMDNARVLVPRVSGKTSYYPCVSEDNNFVVFNQSTCGSDPDVNYGGTAGYGTGTCDGYDDSTAKLYWVSTAGNGTAISLDNANGSSNYDNSWPRFSPDVSTFRGQTLYWVAFSSRRPYGSQLNTGGLVSSQPQLWFSGVTSAEVTVGDPSYAPVWLPGQNPNQATPYGNHVPQWVKVAIMIN
jgi:Tol biopolymer transport system component